MARAEPKPDTVDDAPETLAQLARAALRKADGNTTTATATLTRRLLRSPAVLRTVIEAAVLDAVQYRVEAAMRTDRAQILRVTTSGRGAVVALANGISRAILDMPLANGLRLRDALREQVIEQADRYAAIAEDTGHKARWLTLIGQSMPAKKTVGQVMTDERAAELYEEART
jgi:hypothetical protein